MSQMGETMDMNRIAPLRYNTATNRIGEKVLRPNGKDITAYRGSGSASTGLMVAKINQVIAELEKLQHICFALSKVATNDPNAQDGSDAQASDKKPAA